MSNWSEEMVERAWENGKVVLHNDPSVWRKDDYGAWIHRRTYGDRSSRFGWEIAAESTGSPDAEFNLRPLQWQNKAVESNGRRSYATMAGGRMVLSL